MKRILTICMALVMVLSLAAPACADVLWEPDNNFYQKHSGECTYLSRGYYANGAEGFVTLWDAPGGWSAAGQYENGETLWVYWIYQDWGFVSRWEEGRETTGWVPMGDLALVYDYIAFAEEYADRIAPYDGEFANYDGDAAGVAFYEYPGAPAVKQYWDFAEWREILDNLTGGENVYSCIQSVFVDENGLTWGFVGYMYGRVNAWFCLDDPEGDGEAVEGESVFSIRQVEQEELIPARTPTAAGLPARAYVPYILVGAAVVATAVVLVVFFRKKKEA